MISKKNYSILILIILTFSFQAKAQIGFESKKRPKQDNSSTTWKEDFIEIGRGNLRKPTEDTKKFKLKNDSLDIIYDESSSAIIFFKNNDTKSFYSNSKISFQKLGDEFFSANQEIFKLKEISSELEFQGLNTDELGISHLKYQQKFKNIPVFGAEVLLHGKDRIDVMNGKLYPSPTIENTKPNLSPNDAIEYAFKDLANFAIVNREQSNSLISKTKDKAELFIYFDKSVPKLAYYTTVKANILERWVYMIDANTGEIIYKFNNSCTFDGGYTATAKDLKGVTRTFNTYQSGGNFFMIDTKKSMFNQGNSTLPNDPKGVIWTIDANNSKVSSSNLQLSHVVSSNGANWNSIAVSAHYNASLCFDYFKNVHSRNSLDGKGGNVVSVINLIDDDGKGLDNAFWNGEFMGYGNGSTAFSPLAAALDVAAHELTHGVVENTARLEYRSQSGALNESFADIFGVLVDSNNWTLGEDIVKKSVFPTGALRSMENPNQAGKNVEGYQPKTMSQYVQLAETSQQDNGGVHVNSGIPNYAFYLFATSAGVGREKAGKVYYRALNTYLTRSSKFLDARIAVIQSAKDLYGDGSQVMKAAESAFDQVGITGSSSNNNGGNTNTEIPVNPGEERMVVFDPSDGSMYKVGFQNDNDIIKISNQLGCLGKPSVTDNGQFVYFVGKDQNIYRIDLTASSSSPQKLSDNQGFRNVAISKNGRLLAALAASLDDYIYVFDLQTQKNVKFQLYNPTYSQGVSTGNVLYADSFEWDYSGENLIYDAFNEVKSLFGSYEYWDVGILKAWNNNTNDFNEGTIDKLFSSLEEGENIGNPALAKTTSNIIAFDYYNESDDAYYIVTANFENGNIKTVLENNAIGYPDYAKADNFICFNSLKSNDVEAIDIVPMSSDKTTASGAAQSLFTEAKWGVWYAIGQRELPELEAQTITFNPIPDLLPNQATTLSASTSSNLPIQYILKSGDASINGKIVTAGNTAGKVIVSAFQAGNNTYKEASTDQSFCIIPNAPTITEQTNSITVNGGDFFQWYVNGNPIGGVSSNTSINKDFAGNYSAKAVTADGCYSKFSNQISIVPLATLDDIKNENLVVSPNPVFDQIQVNLKGKNVNRFEIYDLSGRVLNSIEGDKTSLKNYNTGTYIIAVEDQEKSYFKKIIKQ